MGLYEEVKSDREASEDVQDMHEDSVATVIASMIVYTPFLICNGDDQSDETRSIRKSPGTSMFTDDIVICSGNMKKVEESLEWWSTRT